MAGFELEDDEGVEESFGVVATGSPPAQEVEECGVFERAAAGEQEDCFEDGLFIGCQVVCDLGDAVCEGHVGVFGDIRVAVGFVGEWDDGFASVAVNVGEFGEDA